MYGRCRDRASEPLEDLCRLFPKSSGRKTEKSPGKTENLEKKREILYDKMESTKK
jgi:hypothetical protein